MASMHCLVQRLIVTCSDSARLTQQNGWMMMLTQPTSALNAMDHCDRHTFLSLFTGTSFTQLNGWDCHSIWNDWLSHWTSGADQYGQGSSPACDKLQIFYSTLRLSALVPPSLSSPSSSSCILPSSVAMSSSSSGFLH